MNAHSGSSVSSPIRPWQLQRDYAPETARLLAEVEDALPLLKRLEISPAKMRQIFDNARTKGSSFRAALVEAAIVSEEALSQAMAAAVGAEYVDAVPAHSILGADDDCLDELTKANPIVLAEMGGEGHPLTTLLAPRDVPVPELRQLADAARRDRRRMALVSPAVLRRAICERVANRLTGYATRGLFDLQPDYSARHRFSTHQAFTAGGSLLMFALLFWTWPAVMFVAMHLFGSAFFLACATLRATAALSAVRRKPGKWTMPVDQADMPVYSVLVALYREAEVVPQLLVALGRLEWPRDRLEIKLVCEADDLETIAAIKAHNPRSFVEIVEVPPSFPRTKPKALRFAMAMTSGEFIVLYDAEDKPHPGQLLEAYTRFRGENSKLACLQAPLSITNGGRSLLARMFAFEYAGLFRSMLPWLADRNQALPLGGTSNHFRRAALQDIGSWDPHNVTEDADVGFRLFRFGYRVGTIALPTLEAGPEELRVWLPQRARWLKGWLQTWLVHMRRPGALLADVGLPSFLILQVLLAGMFFSALLHPVIFGTAIIYAAMSMAGVSLATWQLWLLGLDWVILLFSYVVFLILGWRSLTAKERIGFPIIVLLTPAYWLLISYAAWLALIEFVRYPHRWNKTPHKPG